MRSIPNLSQSAFDFNDAPTKTCSACTQELPLDRFPVADKVRNTLHAQCRKCRSDRSNHPERFVAERAANQAAREAKRTAPTKRCKDCQQDLPVTEYYMQNKATGKIFPRCKPCHNAFTLSHYNKRTGRVDDEDRRFRKRPLPVEKTCTICKVVKPITEYHRKGERYKGECKACRAAEKAAYTAANRASVHAAAAAYRAARGDALTERQRQWKLDNPDEYSAIHKRSKHKRRLQIAQSVGHWTNDEWQALKQRYEFRCLMCHRQEPAIKLTIDHVVPLARGGDNAITNCQPLCLSCNDKKHTKILDLRT